MLLCLNIKNQNYYYKPRSANKSLVGRKSLKWVCEIKNCKNSFPLSIN